MKYRTIVAVPVSVERHEEDHPVCVGQWCCGCDEHPIGKPWGWNAAEWQEHYEKHHGRLSGTNAAQDGPEYAS